MTTKYLAPLLGLLLVACGSDPAVDIDAAPPPTTYGGDRPVQLQLPNTLEPGKTYPLLVVLHGYSANGFVQQAFFGLGDVATAEKMFVLAPDGKVDSMGHNYWNADPYCCDLDHTGVDDVAYLGGMIDQIMHDWPIDPTRVMLLGHSNGGFMAFRMACDRADIITTIADLAGHATSSTVPCTPSRPVHVLHMHGTADGTIPYDDAGASPGAIASAAQWAARNGCAATHAATGTKDLEGNLPGDETTVDTWDGCPADGKVELWTIAGGAHLPSLSASFRPELLAWLAAHTR